MDTTEMLHRMCHEELSNADVDAIRAHRGFSQQETATGALLENFYLSETGIEEVMGTLTDDEVVFLHLLTLLDDSQAIPLFARLYTDVERPTYGTYTQRYRPIFDRVRKTLIRKGILLFAEDPALSDADTQNERRRYRFPRPFARFLPPPIRATETLEGPGEHRASVLRRKLHELTRGPSTPRLPKEERETYRLALVDGDLYIGETRFAPQRLLDWQRAGWESDCPGPSREDIRQHVRSAYEQALTVSPVTAVTHLLSQLEDHAWVRPERLTSPLRIFCGWDVDAAAVCAAGWRWGRLARQPIDDTYAYRLLAQGTEELTSTDRAAGLRPTGEGEQAHLLLNLEHVAYRTLATLDLISDLEIAVDPADHLAARPNPIEIGRRLEHVRDGPLTPWLRQNASSFRAALAQVEAHWGRHVLHENVLVARINDLGLQVQLEQAFGASPQVVFLADDVLAFPRRMLRDVQRVVSDAGHVVKVVNDDA